MTTTDKILDRIRKLLAKARGTENEAEAALFASRAAEMLQQHNLQEADLGGADATEEMIQRLRKSVDWNPWRIDLIGGVAKLYFSKFFICRYVDDTRLRRGITLVGRPHNLDVTESMFEYLEKTTIRLAKEYSTDRKARLQFEKGCGTRLAQRLYAMANAAIEPTAVLTVEKSNLPALYKTELQLADDIVQSMTGGRTSKSGHRGGGSAALAGSRAADGVSLGAQIGGKTAHLLGSR